VPGEAVITIGDEVFVLVEKNETEYELRNVVTGPTSGDLVKIHKGSKRGSGW
jgi:hypothetical protein